MLEQMLRRDCKSVHLASCNPLYMNILLYRDRLFLIAMDDSDWAIHDSNLAASWRMLAHFD